MDNGYCIYLTTAFFKMLSITEVSGMLKGSKQVGEKIGEKSICKIYLH